MPTGYKQSEEHKAKRAEKMRRFWASWREQRAQQEVTVENLVARLDAFEQALVDLREQVVPVLEARVGGKELTQALIDRLPLGTRRALLSSQVVRPSQSDEKRVSETEAKGVEEKDQAEKAKRRQEFWSSLKPLGRQH